MTEHAPPETRPSDGHDAALPTPGPTPGQRPPADEADVIVVGAGPAGATTAFYLAQSGLDVLLLEKARFPREKVCGDGLTPREPGLLEQQHVEPGLRQVVGGGGA